MAIYTIADPHLSFGTNKPMDMFNGWDNYVDRLKNNWDRVVNNDDIVILVGDISWAINFDELYKDFEYIDSLNGKKIIIKGNHDYWWNTLSKLNKYVDDNGFKTIKFLQNDSYEINGISICGTRFWNYDSTDSEDIKIVERELIRLEMSLQSAKCDEKIVFLHYPPIYNTSKHEKTIELLHKYGVKKCYYGHLHGEGAKYAFDGEYDGIKFKLISCDKVNFEPYYVAK